MTNNEVNKVIAKFMGGPYTGDGCIGLDCADRPYDHCKKGYVCFYCQPIETHYTNYLDALVPVWERLKEDGVWINKMGNRNYNHFGFFSEKQSKDYSPFDPFDFYEKLHTDTIQEAAAHATAKAIMALGEQ